MGVRQLLLADVPRNISQLVQKCGRVSRMHSHSSLRDEEQTVQVKLFVAVLPLAHGKSEDGLAIPFLASPAMYGHTKGTETYSSSAC